ncbi:Ubiquitin carboxyl-terminal hydrolase 14 [Vitis vinifera]|uniref:ubiquitinyl hydrolase 1 n=1 Tax=Vitis vinifera TaxID=29760 RepID=A0A438HEE8_VITVI|nr:Ubiquitin carboxyl-terminal hydrolase 14 [Vitis vinifera]
MVAKSFRSKRVISQPCKILPLAWSDRLPIAISLCFPSLHSGFAYGKGLQSFVDEGKVESEKLLANEEIVAQLVSMGFNHLHCQKAAINTSNAGVEEAMNWLLSHMDDPDIDVPISQEAENAEALSFVDQSKVDTLISFGYGICLAFGDWQGGDIENHQWYADSDANIHVTFDVANLTVSQPYEGIDTVGDFKTGDTLMTGPSDRGLYLINLQQLSSSKFHAFSMTVGVKASTATWHCRLGHPSSSTLHNVRNYSLPVSDSFNKESICVSYQLGKSKQLPFSTSSRESTAPLELIHSNVWSTSTPSLSGCLYYVIFY